MPITIAILDDHAGVAMQRAGWSGLGAISVFRDTPEHHAVRWIPADGENDAPNNDLGRPA
jgi:hypothetical protein